MTKRGRRRGVVAQYEVAIHAMEEALQDALRQARASRLTRRRQASRMSAKLQHAHKTDEVEKLRLAVKKKGDNEKKSHKKYAHVFADKHGVEDAKLCAQLHASRLRRTD